MFKDYFFGNKVSEYGLENGFVDYATLSKAFDAVLNNDIMNVTSDIGYWEQEHGFIDNTEAIEELRERIEELKELITDDSTEEEDNETTNKIKELENEIEELENEMEEYPEIYQYFIISDNGASILKDYTNEIIFYNDALDMYVWGVTHWGTSWSYVLTDIPCNRE